MEIPIPFHLFCPWFLNLLLWGGVFWTPSREQPLTRRQNHCVTPTRPDVTQTFSSDGWLTLWVIPHVYLVFTRCVGGVVHRFLKGSLTGVHFDWVSSVGDPPSLYTTSPSWDCRTCDAICVTSSFLCGLGPSLRWRDVMERTERSQETTLSDCDVSDCFLFTNVPHQSHSTLSRFFLPKSRFSVI